MGQTTSQTTRAHEPASNEVLLSQEIDIYTPLCAGEDVDVLKW